MAFILQGVSYAHAVPPSISEAEFISRSRALNLNIPPSPELDALIAEYETLLNTSESAPGIEWAMYDLARLYSLNNDDHADPIGNSLERSIDLYRDASRVTVIGSKLWFDCRFGLATQLRRAPADLNLLPEARAVIEDVRDRHHDDAVLQLACLEQLLMQCIAEDKLANAEDCCREILSMKEFPKRQLLQACQMTAISTLLQGVLRKSGRKGVTDEWLDALTNDFPQDRNVAAAVTLVREMRESLPLIPDDSDAPLEEQPTMESVDPDAVATTGSPEIAVPNADNEALVHIVPKPIERSQSGARYTVFIAVNVACLLLLIVAVMYRRIWQA